MAARTTHNHILLSISDSFHTGALAHRTAKAVSIHPASKRQGSGGYLDLPSFTSLAPVAGLGVCFAGSKHPVQSRMSFN
jgi:hypothetical protein